MKTEKFDRFTLLYPEETKRLTEVEENFWYFGTKTGAAAWTYVNSKLVFRPADERRYTVVLDMSLTKGLLAKISAELNDLESKEDA